MVRSCGITLFGLESGQTCSGDRVPRLGRHENDASADSRSAETSARVEAEVTRERVALLMRLAVGSESSGRRESHATERDLLGAADGACDHRSAKCPLRSNLQDC